MARRLMSRLAPALALTLAVACVKGGGGEANDDSARRGEPRAQQVSPDTPDTSKTEAPPALPAGNKEQPVAPPTSTSPPEAFTVDSTDGLPADLNGVEPLWEAAGHPSARRSESVARLYPDGRLYRYSDHRRTSVDGMPGREPADLAWRLDAKINAEAVEKVRQIIRNHFAPLAQKPPPVALGPDARLYTWRAHLDGEHVVVTPAMDMNALPAAIRDIERAIQVGVVPGAVPMEQE